LSLVRTYIDLTKPHESTKELAERVGVPYNRLLQYARGERPVPAARQAIMRAYVLRATMPPNEAERLIKILEV